jgi:hypothetical protein
VPIITTLPTRSSCAVFILLFLGAELFFCGFYQKQDCNRPQAFIAWD